MPKLLDDPLLHDHVSFRTFINVSGVMVALRRLLPENLGRLVGDIVVVRAVVRVIVRLRPLRERLLGVYDIDYRVILSMKDERREDSCLRTGAQESIVALLIRGRSATLLNRQDRSIIIGSFVFESRVHTDGGVEIRIRGPHDAGQSSPGGHPGNIYSIRVDVVFGDDFFGSAGGDRRFSTAPFLVGRLEPIPATQRVCARALLWVKDN